jgi:hypothetical protein
MKLPLAESIDALNRIKKTAATICVEERRRGTAWQAHALDRVDRRLAAAGQELAAASAELATAPSVNHPRPGETA